MTLAVGILVITLFYIVTATTIKKYPVVFYLGVYLWQAVVIAYYGLKINENFPDWFTTYFMDIFQRGMFSTVTFMVVMFLGTVTTHNKVTRKLMSIRGELSIIGCLSVICHNVIFGVLYFPALVQHPEIMTTRNIVASIITIILLAMMIPLFITSFKSVRRKMSGKSWKKLQRLAYPFFLLIYVHVMVLYTDDVKKNLAGIVIYTLIFGSYVVLRLRKAYMKKGAKRSPVRTQAA